MPDTNTPIAIGTDLIVNGSFEDVSESSGNNGPSDWGYRNQDGQIVGWTNVNFPRIEQHWDNYGGVVAKDGTYWIDMDGANQAARNRIGQDIANVENGATYQVSFSIADSDNVRDDDGIIVLWNGEVIFDGLAPQSTAGITPEWATYTFDVVGGSGDGLNRLEFIDTGVADSWGAGVALDDVRFVKTAHSDLPPNAAPVAGDDAGFETAYATALTIDPASLLGNDTDGDGDALTIRSVSAVTGGTVALDDDGNVVFTPARHFTGEASFTYTVADGNGGTDTATVSIAVGENPDPNTIDRPVLYAHRGTNPYTDNEHEAYLWAFKYGADYIEIDLRLTADGELVSYHDDLSGGIANMTFAQVRAVVPNILTFQDIITLTKQMEAETGRKLGILVETKSTGYGTYDAMLSTLVANDFADAQHIVFQTFATDHKILRDLMDNKYNVDFPTAWLTDNITDGKIADLTNPNGSMGHLDAIAPQMALINADTVAAARAAGLKVNGWTVQGTEADVQNALRLGVDGIINDNTQWARPALEKLLNNATVTYGTDQRDVTNGGAGNDVVYAMSGDDIVRGGAGNDTLYGDAGNDLLFGGAGNDQLSGGSGDDYLEGGEGADVLDGGAGNDVIVATGDVVVFRAGGGIDLVSLDATSTIRFEGALPEDVTVLRDGNNLIIRAGADALVLHDGVDPAHQPALITTADGTSLTGAQLAALAVEGTDAEVAALLPGLEARMQAGSAYAEASTIALGTDLVSEGDFGDGVLSQHFADAEFGAIYRLSFSLADLPSDDDGVRVIWNGQVVYEGVPSAEGSDLRFIVTGGMGDGANKLVFEGAGGTFGAQLSDVHLVKLADVPLPAPGNVAPEVTDTDLLISRDLPFIGQVVAADANGDTLAYSLGDGPAHGTLVLKEDGTYRYTPDAGFSGQDRFTALVNDGFGGIVETAIQITVADEVLVGTDLIVNGSFEDTTVNGRFEADSGTLGQANWGYYNDAGIIAGWADVNGNRAEIANLPSNQNNVQPRDGAFYFDLDAYGTMSEIAQTVAGVEQGAVYALKFSIADGDFRSYDDGVQVLWGGEVVFEGMPDSNQWADVVLNVTGGAGDGANKLVFKGIGTEDWFGVQLDDVQLIKLADQGEALPENQAPEAADITAEGPDGLVIRGQLSATDADAGAKLVYSLGEQPSHGTVFIYTDGTYRYTPGAGFNGEDSFTYVVHDEHGGTDTATVNLTVNAPGSAVAIGTDLMVNGSFEDVSESSDSSGPGDWGYRNADGQIVGWTNVNFPRIEQHWDNYGGVVAKDGGYWIDLDGAGQSARNRIGQDVKHVETGATYEVSFSIADSDNVRNDDGVIVMWNGEVIFDGLAPQSSPGMTPEWATHTFQVVGGSGDGTNRLEFIDTGVRDSWGAGVALDDVRFVKVADVSGPVEQTEPTFAFWQGATGTPQGTITAPPLADAELVAQRIEISITDGATLVEHTGIWDEIKAAVMDEYQANWGNDITIANFVDVRADFSTAAAAMDVTVVGGKRGTLTGSDFGDHIDWIAFSNETTWSNAISIDAGAGDDVIEMRAISSSTLDDTLLADNADPRNSTHWKAGYDGSWTTVAVDGGEGNDVIRGFDMVRLIATGGAGDDLGFGGGGDQDIWVLSGSQDEYEIAEAEGVWTIHDTLGRDGTDTITGFEYVRFGDGQVLELNATTLIA